MKDALISVIRRLKSFSNSRAEPAQGKPQRLNQMIGPDNCIVAAILRSAYNQVIPEMVSCKDRNGHDRCLP